MSIFDKFLNAIRLNDDYDDEDDFFDEEDPIEPEEKAKPSGRFFNRMKGMNPREFRKGK